jgi:hypothetical protein
MAAAAGDPDSTATTTMLTIVWRRVALTTPV